MAGDCGVRQSWLESRVFRARCGIGASAVLQDDTEVALSKKHVVARKTKGGMGY